MLLPRRNLLLINLPLLRTNKNPTYMQEELVTVCIRGDWKADIAATDKNEIHMIHFADILTDGIVKPFPENFDKKASLGMSPERLLFESALA